MEINNNIPKGIKFGVVVIVVGSVLLYSFEKIYPHTDKTTVLPLVILVSIIIALLFSRKKKS